MKILIFISKDVENVEEGKEFFNAVASQFKPEIQVRGEISEIFELFPETVAAREALEPDGGIK
jgi:hypothetical protein